MEIPSYEEMREAARGGKLVIIERGPFPRRANDGSAVIVPTYEAHFVERPGTWCEVIRDQRDELVRDGATVRNPEAEELESVATEGAE